MKTLIIAEKPSVATDLSRALGKFKKEGNYYENEQYIIAAAQGHIVELFMPDDIDKKLKWWSLKTLPILPEKFELKPIEKTKDRLKELQKLLKRKDVESVINACDAGREGELIFTYLFEYAKCKKPVKRLWISSLTQAAIRNAFDHLRPQDDMVSLQEAAKCRSESDWLIGINGTRAITSRMFGQRSRQIATIGRVQTPTLSLVYEREKSIRKFTPRPFWKIFCDFNVHSGSYQGVYQKPHFKKGDDEHNRADRVWNREEAERVLAEIKNATQAQVFETKKKTTQAPPLLYDLTSLQRDANTRFGMPAGITLKIAQSLYEKHKMITYPRTDSKALPEDYPDVCKETLVSISGKPAEHAQWILTNNAINPNNKRIFNNKKIRDHFAIIPTPQSPRRLSDDEAKIYDLILKRFIAIFFPSAEFNITTRISTIANHCFKTEGKVLTIPGWLSVHGKAQNLQDQLPALSPKDGDPPQAGVANPALSEESTKPPSRYTEATLLSAMEHAGKFVEDEELADAMKDKGLGTPATRAQIIEHLIREKYILRENRELSPTVKAENLVEFLKVVQIEFLTTPAMTGEWEYKLHQIEEGSLSRKDFMAEIFKVTTTIIDQTKNFDETTVDTSTTNIISPTDGKPMLETFRAYRSQSNDLVIYKTIGNRKLAPNEVQELLNNRSIGPLDGFRSKAGRPFSAILKLDEENKVKFDFGTPSEEGGDSIDISQFAVISDCPLSQKKLCDHDSGKIYTTPNAYQCEYYSKGKCSFRVSRTLLSRSIPEDQFLKLVNEGKTDLLDKFRSKRTKRFFSAHLTLKDNGQIGFEFAPKKPKADKKAVTSKAKSKPKAK